MKFRFFTENVYDNFRPNEVFRPASVGFYYIVLTIAVLYLGLVLMTPPATAIDVLNARCYGVFEGDTINCGYPDGYTYAPNRSIDGNILTSSVIMSYPEYGQYTDLKLNFPSATTLDYCEFRTGPVSIGGCGSRCGGDRTIQINYNSTHLQKTVPMGVWTKIQWPYPTNVGSYIYVRELDTGKYFSLNETRCFGWNTTYTDFPNYVAFTGTPVSGDNPLYVTFTTTGSTYYNPITLWDFGDGSAPVNGSYQSIGHTYSTSGNYSVTLQAYNATYGWGNMTRQDYITVNLTTATLADTYFQCVNGNTNGRISGCNLYLQDETSGRWENVTDDDDGTYYITAATDHTLRGIGEASGFVTVTRTGLTPIDEVLYELIMWPESLVCATPGSCIVNPAVDPGEGNVNLLVEVNDKHTGAGLAGAEVSVTETDGSTLYGTTNEAGIEMFFYPNSTTVNVCAAKDGYTSVCKGSTTTSFGPDTIRIELPRQTVTPTVTITGPGGEPVETVDPRPETEKDQDLFNQIREEAPGLIDLGLLVLLVGLLKLIFKF